jgi:hypothetical protein
MPTITTINRTKEEIIHALKVAAVTGAVYYLVDGVRTVATDMWKAFTYEER